MITFLNAIYAFVRHLPYSGQCGLEISLKLPHQSYWSQAGVDVIFYFL